MLARAESLTPLDLYKTERQLALSTAPVFLWLFILWLPVMHVFKGPVKVSIKYGRYLKFPFFCWFCFHPDASDHFHQPAVCLWFEPSQKWARRGKRLGQFLKTKQRTNKAQKTQRNHPSHRPVTLRVDGSDFSSLFTRAKRRQLEASSHQMPCREPQNFPQLNPCQSRSRLKGGLFVTKASSAVLSSSLKVKM